MSENRNGPGVSGTPREEHAPAAKPFPADRASIGALPMPGTPEMEAILHPPTELLDRFMRGQLPADENLAVLQHLLSGCARCRAITREVWDVVEEDPAVDLDPAAIAAYDEVVDRAYQAVRQAGSSLRRERSTAPPLLAELLALPEEERRAQAVSSPRFASWGLCELLLSRCEEEWLSDPRQAAATAELAALLAGRLRHYGYPLVLAFDLQARIEAARANALRIQGDFPGAEAAFARADQLLSQGTGDRLEKARVLDLLASLRVAQGRLRPALTLLDRAAAIYRRAGQRHLTGRTLIHKGHALVYAGIFTDAVAALRLGVSLLDAGREPRLMLAAQHNLAFGLNETGHPNEALALTSRNRALYVEPLDRVRLRLLEGEIALSLGRWREAELACTAAREAFGEQGMMHDVALASLGLATAYAAEGRLAELRVLASETLALFTALDLGREALAAWLLLEKAAEAEQVSALHLREIARELRAKLRSTRSGVLPPVL